MRIDVETQLDEVCWVCDGSGRSNDPAYSHNGVCEMCDGIGWKPTVEGQKIIDFLRLHKSRL